MLAPEVIESAEKRVGETIAGKWHLDRVIGVGGMAAVYEATHRNRNRVALKLLHPALSLEEGTRSRFLREGYVANTIRHSGAVQVLDDDVTEEGYAFLVMELLRGESVEERMHRKGGALDRQESLSIAEQLLDVLEAAHDQGVIHRDIKPDNLFLTEEGKLKVLDFGIARLTQGNSKATKVGSFMGTPAFCAQEQARGRWDEVDHRTDLYSVGATLFTCLTGMHVHEAETSSEQLALAIGATARSLASAMPDAPPDLVELVDMSLSYDKEDRFQSARAMRAAVQRVRAGLPVAKKISTPAPPPSGARTFGPIDPDPESVRPLGLGTGLSQRHVLIGLVTALALALGIFLVSRPESVAVGSGKAGSDDGAKKANGEGEPPTPSVASSPSSEASGTKGDQPGVDVRAGEPKASSPLAAPHDKGSSQPRPSATSSPSGAEAPPGAAPQASPRADSPPPVPSPTPAPESSSREDLFDRRF